jgi:hypothetical protein
VEVQVRRERVARIANVRDGLTSLYPVARLHRDASSVDVINMSWPPAAATLP